MKRARDSTDDTSTTNDSSFNGTQHVTPNPIHLSAVPAAADDNDPYGFGNVGAPGFVSRPTSMKSGYVPGFRVQASIAGSMAPGGIVKSARTAMSGPGARPTSAARGSIVQPQAAAQGTAQGSAQDTAQANPLPTDEPDLVPHAPLHVQLPLSPASAMPEDSEAALMLQRKRVQNRDLPEQHRLPDDLPAALPGKIPDTSASASGPLSAQIKALPKFHDEIQAFVDQSIPNQAEQLIKVQTSLSGDSLVSVSAHLFSLCW